MSQAFIKSQSKSQNLQPFHGTIKETSKARLVELPKLHRILSPTMTIHSNTPVSTIMNNVITTTTRDTAITEQAIEKPIEDRSGHLDSKVDKEDLLGE